MFHRGKFNSLQRHFFTLHRYSDKSFSTRQRTQCECLNFIHPKKGEGEYLKISSNQKSRGLMSHRNGESKWSLPNALRRKTQKTLGELYTHPLHKRFPQTDLSCRQYSSASNTVAESLAHWSAKLEDAGVPESRLSAEHITAHVVGIPRGKLHENSTTTVSEALYSELDRLMTCRLARMPVQYIVGEWDFYNITLKMRPPVFIPRPETECLVEKALELLRGISTPKVLEIGCGSGAISLSLLKSVKDLQCVAVDQSKHAVSLTKENAQHLKLDDRLVVVEGKVTHEKFPTLPYEHFDLVVSNPPYVLRKDLMEVQPEIMIFEDMRALDGGKDGLDTIKPILLHCQHFLPQACSILMEVDPCHRYLLPAWLKTQPSIKLEISSVMQDLNGKDRFILFTKL
ncbi:MTRF1L release factor glutamine methyltransferase-like [Penaeus japonicus]|uniref:MTRF1L release factor glutamine methyltransferase-like n=1 Tax=Penaeus japonicus TaxID=27405 RepID=UPI001C715FF9|nr:MTRF1L release factor glutamine methyltransferase-like [Penaeus japonicus]